nr:serine/threonine-protein kinase nak1 [Quercus suber]
MAGYGGTMKPLPPLPPMDTVHEEDFEPVSCTFTTDSNVLIESDEDNLLNAVPLSERCERKNISCIDARSIVHPGSFNYSNSPVLHVSPGTWFRGDFSSETPSSPAPSRLTHYRGGNRSSFSGFSRRVSQNVSPLTQGSTRLVTKPRESRSSSKSSPSSHGTAVAAFRAVEGVGASCKGTLTSSTGFLKSVDQKLRALRQHRKAGSEVGTDKADKRVKNLPVLDKENTKKLSKFWNLTERSEVIALPEGRGRIRKHTISLPTNYLRQLSGCTHYESSAVLQDSSHIPIKLRGNSLFDLITRVSMNSADPAGIMSGPFEGLKKEKQRDDAQAMYKVVVRNAERSNVPVPPYEFLEFAGKGGSGRVYKCRHMTTGVLVAVKIINVDDIDYEGHAVDKDEVIKNFRLEVVALQQLKDSKAKNVNVIHDAFDLHDQLWMVSDWCTGGSIRTLMRANTPVSKGLEERYIIPVARELAIAVKSVHDIGIIHRDIKCTNVYINEEGNIQLGDYGVNAEIDFATSKRNTIIGTPHYMPPDVWNSQNREGGGGYGKEVDIWAYGCTVYEMATGLMPYNTTDTFQLHQVNNIAPALNNHEHSQALCDFVAFCLQLDPQNRPSAETVLDHPYIANTMEQYPTSSLREVIDRFSLWEYRGGQRQSLWASGGAAAPKEFDDEPDVDDANGWDFNTSESYNMEFGQRLSQMIASHDFAFDNVPSAGLPPLNTDVPSSRMQALEEHFREMSAARGERLLDRVFNPGSIPYELHTPLDESQPDASDLRLRPATGGTSIRESFVEIDLDSATVGNYEVPAFDFSDAPTLRARVGRRQSVDVDDEEENSFTYNDQENEKRATIDWTFPTKAVNPADVPAGSLATTVPEKRATMAWTFQTAEPAEPDEPDMRMDFPVTTSDDDPPGFRPTLKHTVTEPVGQFGDNIHLTGQVMPRASSPRRDSTASMIDLDLASPEAVPRPSTALSMLSSTDTDRTSGNPFDLDDDMEHNGVDRNRYSYHKQWQSEGGQMKRLSHKSMQMHSRGNSLNDTDSDTFDSGLSRNSSTVNLPRTHPNVRKPSIDTNQWPSFGPDSSLDDEPHDSYMMERSVTMPSRRSSRIRSHAHAQNGQPEIEFPLPEPPHPQAMLEDADPGLVAAELNRMLAELDFAFRATSRALHRNTGMEQFDDGGGLLSGFDRGDMSTDEDGY